jgi:hypothetical protein
MRALTSTELADILFQKPDRITAGILNQRSPAEKLRDNVFTYQKERSLSPINPGKMEQLRKKLLLHFEAEARVSSEHPRSLKHAVLELKALGFSNQQIEDIKTCCYRFTLGNFHDDAPLRDPLHNDNPGYRYAWCDDAFLGAALVPWSGSTSFKSTEDNFAVLDQYKKDRHNPAQTKNTMFTPEREAEAYSLFQEHVASYVDSGWKGSSDLLMPAKPHQRYKAICP